MARRFERRAISLLKLRLLPFAVQHCVGSPQQFAESLKPTSPTDLQICDLICRTARIYFSADNLHVMAETPSVCVHPHITQGWIVERTLVT
jgi:hypothetical protein